MLLCRRVDAPKEDDSCRIHDLLSPTTSQRNPCRFERPAIFPGCEHLLEVSRWKQRVIRPLTKTPKSRSLPACCEEVSLLAVIAHKISKRGDQMIENGAYLGHLSKVFMGDDPDIQFHHGRLGKNPAEP